MEQLINVASVPAIMLIVCVVMQLGKEAYPTEKFKKKIPLLAAVLGGVLGVLCFYCAPSIIAADNFLGALTIGIGSGLASVGANQITKQSKQTLETKIEDKESDPK